MKLLHRTVGKANVGGEALPPVFQQMGDAGMVIRRSEVSMIAAPPGVGKSTLALAFALRAGVPTLYFSADTNPHTMAMRLFSMLTGKSQREAEEFLLNDITQAEQVLAKAGHIFWCFDSSPNLDDIDLEIRAFEEVHGYSPHLVVVDNLMDVAMDSGEEFSAMRAVMKELKYIARDTNAAVVVLHHTQESYNGDPCPPRASLQGKVSQLPALILTLGQTGTGFLGVAAVKNRYGKVDPSGGSPVYLQFNGEYMYIADPVGGR